MTTIVQESETQETGVRTHLLSDKPLPPIWRRGGPEETTELINGGVLVEKTS